MERKYIADTSFFLNFNLIYNIFKIYTVPEVIEEVKDRLNRIKLGMFDINVLNPKKKTIEEIKKKILEFMPLEKLSDTDIKIIALAYELKGIVLTDDFSIQNACYFLRIPFQGVTREIKEAYIFRKLCPNCRKIYSNDKKKCSICGSNLKIIIYRKISRE